MIESSVPVIRLECIKIAKELRRTVLIEVPVYEMAAEIYGWVESKCDIGIALESLRISIVNRPHRTKVPELLTSAEQAYKFALDVREPKKKTRGRPRKVPEASIDSLDVRVAPEVESAKQI